MGAVGDIYQLSLEQEYLGQACFNIFHYRQQTENTDTEITTSEALGRAFDALILTFLKEIQVTTVEYKEINVFNLFNPEDVYSRVPTTETTGAYVSTDALNTFHAIELRTLRVRRDIKRGFKRFTGMDESMVIAGILNPALSEDVANVRLALSNDQQLPEETDTPVWRPVIVKRVKYVAPSGKTAYRLPESTGELVYNRATWEYARISTQNSRKSWS